MAITSVITADLPTAALLEYAEARAAVYAKSKGKMRERAAVRLGDVRAELERRRDAAIAAHEAGQPHEDINTLHDALDDLDHPYRHLPEADYDPIEDFNYVGSRHHY